MVCALYVSLTVATYIVCSTASRQADGQFSSKCASADSRSHRPAPLPNAKPDVDVSP